MRAISGALCIALSFAAGGALAAPKSLTAADAQHLLIRTGFAPSKADIDRITGQNPDFVISGLIERARAAKPIHPPPASVFGPIAVQAANWIDLRAWWLQEMLESSTPFAERITLFWHGHFATSQYNVRPRAMWNQHVLLRTHALGSFRVLLHGIAKDPAMLLYLNGAESRKEAPNENFAREVMELFTLGEPGLGRGFGGYTEKDVKEAARAFTGWGVNREDFTFQPRPDLHDGGIKTVLGRTGPLTGEATLDILLEEPATARFIVTKLWKEFVSPQPDPDQLERIAQQFRKSDYDVAVALRALLLSDAFWDDVNRGTLIKSPIDFLVGTIRQFGFGSPPIAPLVQKTAQLGQNLFEPANVKGWPGYTHWINSSSLMERKRFTEQLFRSAQAPAPRDTSMPRASAHGVLDKWLALYGATAEFEPSDEVKARLARAVLVTAPTRPIAHGVVGSAYIRLLTLDPAYQLK